MHASSHTVTVDAPAARFTGLTDGSVNLFRGIRYAAAPTGPLRFRPPQRIPESADEVDATAFGMRCHQFGVGVDVIFPHLPVEGVEGEDCLVLNVFTPAAPGAARPVMVWIHGGAFINGSSNDYDASTLVGDHDIVVVTISYRLGIFGFLDLSRIGTEFDGSASLGIQDQIAALGWVRDNVAAFGGDPSNVTIMGESAGGASVHALMGSPAAEGLFHRAIACSGAEPLTPPRDQLTPIVEHLGAASDEDCLAQMMAMSSHELATLQVASGFYPGSSIDGTVVTRPTCEAIRDGGAASVPFIAGTVPDEGTFLAPHYALSDEILFAMVAGVAMSVGRDDGAAYMAFLDREIGLGNLLQCLERAWFDCFRASAVRAAATATEHGAGGWLYDFEVETDHELGVTHFADVPFTFNWVRDGHPREFVHPSTPENEEIAEMWSATVVEFVKHGDPNGHGLPEWPTYGPDDRCSLRVRRQSEVVQDVDADLLEIYRAI